MEFDALGLFLATRDPAKVERERFGKVNVERNIAAGEYHRQEINEHTDRVKNYWASIRNADNISAGELAQAVKREMPKHNKKKAPMTDAQRRHVQAVFRHTLREMRKHG